MQPASTTRKEVAKPEPKLGQRTLERIGNTPLLRLTRIAAEFPDLTLLGKAEWLNPGGSVKDRAASNIVAEGRASGRFSPDKILTSGVENSPHHAQNFMTPPLAPNRWSAQLEGTRHPSCRDSFAKLSVP